MDLLTTQNILFVVTMLGVIFTVYAKVRDPQQSLDKQQALNAQEADKKAAILAQQLQSDRESNGRRFIEMNNAISTAMTTAQNHIHSIDVKVDSLISLTNEMTNRITKLETMIEERIPKK